MIKILAKIPWLVLSIPHWLLCSMYRVYNCQNDGDVIVRFGHVLRHSF